MRTTFLIACLVCNVAYAQSAALTLTSPKPHQVTQRLGFDSTAKDRPGYADIPISADFAKAGNLAWESRVELISGPTGPEPAWSPLSVHENKATSRVPAGGWYRLDVRGRDGDKVVARGSVEPIGVGEVFVVAGQSYATNCNDERLKVSDPEGRVVALDVAAGTWAVANDPQPVFDKSDGGSIWPPLGDKLAKEFGVPVGFANVAIGGTSSAQWLPEGQLHPRLFKAAKELGHFRAVLWQQGESDVIAKTTKEKYIANIKTIRGEFAKARGVNAPWLIAKSTHHPTVYNDPEGEGRIRAAYDELTKLPGFRPGPDTDTLRGENRGDAKSRRHFSATGQRNAADMWFSVLKQELNSPRPLAERVSELRLLEPAWATPVVHRETSVLLQLKPDGPITARLAFPAAEILEVGTANGAHRFDAGDYKLSDDGLTLTFAKPGPAPVIKAADMFPPKGSPNSYSSRVGHPEQNLLYGPGKWFHDHDVEVTYRRREAAKPLEVGAGSLPKTLARLKGGNPIVLGISGDSISTGLDSSSTSKSLPNQPGYADLVAAQLQATHQCEVRVKNRAVAGWSVANGVADLDKLLAEKPDLVIVAYGMNDVGRRDPKWFGQQTKAILDKIHAAMPETEVILVATMLGNAEWVHTPRDMFAKYRDELKALCGPGVALADVTAVWDLLLKNKHDLDLSGNGLNHPNDFGHRLYAQTILAQLRAK